MRLTTGTHVHTGSSSSSECVCLKVFDFFFRVTVIFKRNARIVKCVNCQCSLEPAGIQYKNQPHRSNTNTIYFFLLDEGDI